MSKKCVCNNIRRVQPFDTSRYVVYGSRKKRVTGENIIYRSPDWFLSEVSKVNDIPLRIITEPNLKSDEYADLMLKGAKFPALTYRRNRKARQVSDVDGIHRAIAAKQIGLKRVPIVIY